MRSIGRRVGIGVGGALLVLGVVSGPALGVGHPGKTGQPGVECEDVRPGHADTAPGSAFNEDGVAGEHYAGEQPQNSRNSHSVSQYDVACLRIPQS